MILIVVDWKVYKLTKKSQTSYLFGFNNCLLLQKNFRKQ